MKRDNSSVESFEEQAYDGEGSPGKYLIRRNSGEYCKVVEMEDKIKSEDDVATNESEYRAQGKHYFFYILLHHKVTTN